MLHVDFTGKLQRHRRRTDQVLPADRCHLFPADVLRFLSPFVGTGRVSKQRGPALQGRLVNENGRGQG